LGDESTTRSFYFVHSYYLQCVTKEIVIGTCDYGTAFTAAIQQDNIFATQFHPEKSHRAGLNLLRNFLSFSSDMQVKKEQQQGVVC
jgi:imidazole glycerol-phosphate synthase subunit HisH